jgi:hypothetical protein
MTKLAISIDDITPHPKSSVKVLDRCFRLIDTFPDIKFDLFVPLAYWRTIPSPSESICQSPMKISDFPEFCETIRKLPSKNFEIGIHGYYHGIPGVSNNDEFKTLSFNEAKNKFHQIFAEIYAANLRDRISPIFRPPAWRMSPDSIRAAFDSGISLLTLSPKDYAQQSYEGAHKSFGKFTLYDGNPPFDELSTDISNHHKYEIVYHACEWDKNYLSLEMTSQLETWIQERLDQLEFSFLSEIES